MSERAEEATTSRSEQNIAMSPGYEAGQRLYCPSCRSEIEIISPCTCDPPDQRFVCCGQPMRPTTGVSVHLNVEA